ncbi:MAG: ABC transporter ATP-binding protein [Pseudomonadales bacterium]|jgi:branched-chain amino acid transport system ATP-binding protein|tara:strand:- start:723 stop:1469 length:747 start_codon:yes stop_codon:yes gene_type:complete
MLKVTDLSKSFGGLKAVNQVSLNVREGQIVSLIGPNGAGKTTMFAMVAGFIEPNSGTVMFDGNDITGQQPHRICDSGMVRTFQITQPFAKLSTLENIMVGAYCRTGNRRQAEAEARIVAKQVGMEDLLNKDADSLTVSGCKRLELARALATKPRLLLLDEVMAGLNPTEIDETVEVIKGIRSSGVTIFLIEHVMKAVVNLSDYSYVLNDGVLIAQGTPTEIANDKAVIEAYLGHGAAELMQKRGISNA